MIKMSMSRSVVCAVVLTAVSAGTATAQDLKAKGEKLFADQKCSLCHSIGGKGNAKGPLDKVATTLSEADIRAWLTDSKGMAAKTKATRTPAMKQFDLKKADVDALVAYLQSLSGK